VGGGKTERPWRFTQGELWKNTLRQVIVVFWEEKGGRRENGRAKGQGTRKVDAVREPGKAGKSDFWIFPAEGGGNERSRRTLIKKDRSASRESRKNVTKKRTISVGRVERPKERR